MRVTLFIIFLTSCLLPHTVFAQRDLNKCFEEETNGSISMCLTVGYTDLENKRLIIEKEAMNFAKEYDEHAKEEKRKKEEAEQDDNEAETNVNELSFSQIEYQNSLDNFVAQYLSIGNLIKSREVFETYRDIECERQRTFLGRQGYEATFAEKVCLYNLTSRRIKDIEESVK